MIPRLKQSEVAAWRQARLVQQGGKCALCKQIITEADPAVADHDHATGLMRDVLHRSCNAALGKVENALKRTGVRHQAAFLAGAWPYLQKHQTPQGEPVLHYTHRTAEEKREGKNAKARLARARRAAV